MKNNTCLFCAIPKERIILEYDLAYAVRDGFPVTPLHSLVIPKRHVIDYFGLTKEELLCCYDMLHELRTGILAEDKKVEGFNVGMNVGEAGGQSIFHCHIHLIPRRTGDVLNPLGGVRNVIPKKRSTIA